MKILAMVNSFHTLISVYTATEIIPGIAVGNTIFQYVW